MTDINILYLLIMGVAFLAGVAHMNLGSCRRDIRNVRRDLNDTSLKLYQLEVALGRREEGDFSQIGYKPPVI